MGKNKTTEEFIKKAREVHGDKYDYSKVEYKGCHTKVCIICPKHGEFWQTPNGHLNGKGCPKCAGVAKSTTEEFIHKAKGVHSDKYDYSKVEYVNSYTKVCIICPEHGEFWSTPHCHLDGKGCPKCAQYKRGIKSKLTTEEFIRRAREIHGDKYDYSKVEYTHQATKVRIICPEHGEFWQKPAHHMNGNGCPKCAGRGMTTETFIKKAREIHGDKYDYSKVVFCGKHKKVCIICPEHGEFWQTAHKHLDGNNCPKCAGVAKSTTEEFIHKAKDIHGDKYDYSKVEYKGTRAKVCIICPEHGEFWQFPTNHLAGRGCPICNNGYTKQYKFNLLQEFKDEYAFRAFLENSDTNILMVILRNIELKYDPIKKDIERVLTNVCSEDPIKALEEKYSSDTDDEAWAEEPVVDVDLDDDDAIDVMIHNENKHGVNKTQTIEDAIRNTEQEIKVISNIEHMLTPEDRKYIMDKFLNDKRRAWMLKREESVK